MAPPDPLSKLTLRDFFGSAFIEPLQNIAIGMFRKRCWGDREPESPRFRYDNHVRLDRDPRDVPFDRDAGDRKFTMANQTWYVRKLDAALVRGRHVLLSPDADRLQYLRRSDLAALTEVLQQFPAARIVYQSLGAGTVVNNLHFHVLGDEEFPVEKALFKEVAAGSDVDVSVTSADQWPATVFRFMGETGQVNHMLGRYVMDVQKRDVPFDILWAGENAYIAVREKGTPKLWSVGAWEVFGIYNSNDLDFFTNLNQRSMARKIREEVQLAPDSRALETCRLTGIVTGVALSDLDRLGVGGELARSDMARI